MNSFYSRFRFPWATLPATNINRPGDANSLLVPIVILFHTKQPIGHFGSFYLSGIQPVLLAPCIGSCEVVNGSDIPYQFKISPYQSPFSDGKEKCEMITAQAKITLNFVLKIFRACLSIAITILS